MEFASRRPRLLLLAVGLLLAVSLATSGCRRKPAAGTRPGQAAGPAPATFPLRGRVVDTAGRAIPGARVLTLPRVDGDTSPAREALSDGEGRFAFERLPAGRYTLVVEATGLLPATPPPVDVPGTETLVRLAETGRALSGHVVAAGVPVAGARVRLGGEGVVPARATSTDATGAFVFHGLGAGRYTLRASSGPLVSPSVEGLADGLPDAGAGGPDAGAAASLRLELGLGVVVTGNVADDRGLPMPAVEVSASLAAQESDVLPELAATGADGRFSLGPLAPGTVRLAARAPGYLLRDTPTVSLVAGQPAPATRLELVRGASVSGRVADARGAAVAGAEVRCVGAGTDDLVVLYEPLPLAAEAAALGGTGRALAGARATRTDARGVFVIDGLLPGRVHLEVARVPLVPLRTGDWNLTPGQRLDAGVLTLRDGLLLSGRVVDEGRAPVAGARVTTTPATGLFAEADASGAFQLALPPGDYAVTAAGRDGGAASANVRLAAGATPPTLTLTLTRADATLEGLVLDSGRRPLARARVRAFAADPTRPTTPPGTEGTPPAPAPGSALSSALTDAGGHFVLSHLPRRPLLIEVDHAAYPHTWAPATPGTHAEVTVPIPGGIDGEIRERASGATVPRARVEALGPGKEKVEAAANDKRAGAFRLGRLRPGHWTLTALAPGYVTSTREVDVPASAILGDASVRGLRLELDAAPTPR
jgi:protocatechuate 3,4-dioxygenase beta subunit